MGGTPSTVGTNKKTYTILAYVLGWIGGLIFLFVGKDDPDVKWNAAQSLLIFGGLTVLIIVLGFIPIVNIVSTAVLWIIGLIFWIYFLIKSLQGNGERIPAPVVGGFLSGYTDQLANSIH